MQAHILEIQNIFWNLYEDVWNVGSYYAVLTKMDTAHKRFSQHFISVCAWTYTVIYSLFSICQHSAPLRSGVHDKLNSWRANLLINTRRATGEFRSLAGEVSYKTWIGMRGDYCFFVLLQFIYSFHCAHTTQCESQSIWCLFTPAWACGFTRWVAAIRRWINSILTEIFSLKNNLLLQKLKWDDCSQTGRARRLLKFKWVRIIFNTISSTGKSVQNKL